MFGTSGIRGEIGSEVTADLALNVGRALASERYDRVVVGRDTRETGVVLADALSAGLRECGAEAIRVGVTSTPTLARGVDGLDADAGVAVTASHNPPTDNGLKLWTAAGRAFDAARREAVTDRIADRAFEQAPWNEFGRERVTSGVTRRHRESLVDATDPLDGLDVVVDVGNGAGRVTADALDDLGCSVTTLNGQRDGSFPGRPSEPTADHCSKLRALVGRSDADLGVAHDGDADRMMAVTESGTFVPGDVLLALFARETASAGDRVAAPLNTSLAVDDALDPIGASVTRTRVGDVHVAARTTEADVVFGGEPSGAWIWPSETRCPDGPLAACRLAEFVREEGSLDSLVDSIETHPLRRGSVRIDDKDAVVERVRRSVTTAYDEVDDTDGVRVDLGDGWFLVRASGTQPLVRVTAEARTPERAADLFEAATDHVDRAADGSTTTG